MCLRSKLLHPPIVPPLLFSLLTPFYLFSFFAVSSKKNQMLNSNKSSFRIDNLSPAHLGGQTSQQWGKARPPVFIPPMFHQENYFLGPISPFLENLSLFIKRVTLALKAFNRHHFNGLSAFSQAWQYGVWPRLPSLICRNSWDGLAWWAVGINALIEYVTQQRGWNCPWWRPCWLLGLYWPVCKLPAATHISFVWLLSYSLPRFSPLLYIYH